MPLLWKNTKLCTQLPHFPLCASHALLMSCGKGVTVSRGLSVQEGSGKFERMCAQWRPSLGRDLEANNTKTESRGGPCSHNGSVLPPEPPKTYDATLQSKWAGCNPVARHHSCPHPETQPLTVNHASMRANCAPTSPGRRPIPWRSATWPWRTTGCVLLPCLG